MRGWQTRSLAREGGTTSEQWPRQLWEQHASLMQVAGGTFATFGVSFRTAHEPEPGRFGRGQARGEGRSCLFALNHCATLAAGAVAVVRER